MKWVGGLGVQGSGFRGFKGGGAAHFIILNGEKRRVLKNGYLKI